MSGVRATHDVHFMDADLFFFVDALEHALRTRSPHANLDSGILGFERLPQSFRDRNFHRRVERERTLLAGGLDQGRTQRGWLRRGRRERFGKDGAGRQHRRCREHVASGKLAISHVRFTMLGNSAKAARATVNAEKDTTPVTVVQGCCHPVTTGGPKTVSSPLRWIRVKGGSDRVAGRAALERKPIDVLTQNNYSGSGFARVSGRKGAATRPRI